MSEHTAENDAPVVTYSVEGYSLGMPMELHTFSPYWGGYEDVESARRMVRDLGNPRYRFRVVRVTREVVEYVIPPGEPAASSGDVEGVRGC